ncbi:MAG: histidine kinase [Firmicutes bacterium]|jgi:two-component system LytT family sensor kinase|nr:histidine kinase [Bacillota bacterium]
MLELFQHLINNVGYILVMGLVISKMKLFSRAIQKDRFKKSDIVLFSIVFSAFGIIGTYIGVEIHGAIANIRNIGVVMGGILGGPIVGMIAGALAGIHRIAIDVGGITSVPCGIATFIGGTFSGLLYKYLPDTAYGSFTKRLIKNKRRLFIGIFAGFITENLSMLLILLMSKPSELAFEIVSKIYLPMVFVNAFGVGLILIIMENQFEENENLAARQSKLALEIANKTMPHFRSDSVDSYNQICKVIKESIAADAVSMTDKEYVLAHYGLGDDHHYSGRKIITSLTERVISTGKAEFCESKDDISCIYENCPLASGIIVPLKVQDEVIGTLKIYYKKEKKISFSDKVLADGLSQLISTQLEIKKIDELEKMANKAEIKLLQSQINPHFLFNSLNTIISLIRTSPNDARDLIVNLSTYLRYNIDLEDEMVPLTKELEQVRAYVGIESARFGDKLIFRFSSECDMSNIMIPSLVIQPIVENSIKHGFKNGKCCVEVDLHIKKENENIHIEIVDNSGGMDKDTILSIMNNQRNGGIGLINVNSRLKLIYGEGIKITSEGEKTTVKFVIRDENQGGN